MHSSRIACLVVAGLALAACSKKKDDAPAAKPIEAVATPGSAVVAVKPGVAGPDDGAKTQAEHSIFGKLQSEKENRQKVALPVETVFAALDKAGIKVEGQTQYLGVTAGASYCFGGVTPDGIPIAVCEYTSPDAAKGSSALIDKRFPGFKGAQRIANGATTLSVGGPSIDLSQHPGLLEKATTTFSGL